MATENATTTIQNDNTDPRYDAMNEGEQALAELHAISDLLVHSNPQNLAEETVSTIGGMLDAIGLRLQRTVDVLYRKDASA